jgi:hypothetical protein
VPILSKTIQNSLGLLFIANFYLRVLESFTMKGLTALFIFFRLISIILGNAYFEALPSQINSYLETNVMSPDLQNLFELIRQRKVLKPYSKNLDMKLLDDKDETQSRLVIN